VGVLVGAVVAAAPVLGLGPSGTAVPGPAPAPHSPAAVDPQFLPTILTSTNATTDGHFGQSIAVSGSTVVVGAPDEMAYVGGYYDDGLVHVTNLKTGTTKVLAGRASSNVGAFGWSVAIDSSYIVVGAPGEGFGSTYGVVGTGHVFVYNSTTLAEVASYASPNAQYWYDESDSRDWNDEFGASVAISGDLMVVGAPGENASGQLAAGHAYVINIQTGATIMLASPFPEAAAYFGGAVAISGDYVVVGAPDQGIFSIGGAYLYSAITGDLIETFTSPGASIGESFGASVAIYWPTVAIGAPFQTVPHPCPAGIGEGQCGAVYLFSLVGGPTTTLLNPDPTTEAEFGASLSMDSALVVVGVPDEDVGMSVGTGSVLAFSRVSGELINSTFSPPEWPSGADFGTAVALNATAVFVGAPDEHAAGFVGAGHAFVFDKIPLSIGAPYLQYGGTGFGESVSIQSEVTAIGAPNASVSGMAAAGQAYLSRSELGPLVAFNGSQAGEEFGAAVAASPTYFVVGAPGADGGEGEVFVYFTSSGLLDTTLGPGVSGAALGTALALSGDTLVAGAPGVHDAVVYDLSTNNLLTTFTGPVGSGLGVSVAVSGTTVVLGAPEWDLAYVLSLSPSVEYTVVEPPFGVLGAFGTSVAVAGGTIVVGAPSASGGGQAYVYSTTTDALLLTLSDPNATSGGAFGTAVADNGATIVVGAPGEEPYASASAGNIFLYGAGSGAVLDRYNAPVPTPDARFGYSISIGAGGKILVGESPTTAHVAYGAPVELFFF